eukprot:GGOE01045890.1.p1 GENE.GGOE01045890.1~~GGOE01045890.1.p1  ORF type:complete len:223 (-),score=57.02 GGOE01045890.1:225-893(-)
MGCTSSVQAISIEATRPEEDHGEGSKDRGCRPEVHTGNHVADAPPQPEEVAPNAIIERTATQDLPPPTPPPPPSVPLPNQSSATAAAEEEEQNLYAPPMSPQKLESIQKWVDSLPSPSEVARDVLENPVIHEILDGTASEQSSCRDVGQEERRSSLTAEHLKHHTRVLSAAKGRATPLSPGMHETFHSDAAQNGAPNGDNTASSPTQTPSQPQASFTLGTTT